MSGPHTGVRVEHLGAPLAQAAGAIILLHGRGASAEDILGLARAMFDPRLAYLAPQATNSTWYPNSFMAPRVTNEPWLTSALDTVASLVDTIVAAGLSTDRIAFVGFSQGACLSTEFVATHPSRYAGLVALTGGLIGPAGANLHHPGSLAGTPVFFGSGDPDPHVPWTRVEESAAVLTAMGAQVITRRYIGRPHTVSAEELDLTRDLLAKAFTAAEPSPAHNL